MDLKSFGIVFVTVFLAELGDKTQLATVLFATDRAVSAWTVFAGSAAALVLAAAMGVLAGEWIGQHVDPRRLAQLAGAGFVLIGLWTLLRA